MKKEKSTRSGAASKRAKDLLEYHAGLLTRPGRTFRMFMDEGYYLENRINPENSDDFVKICYTVDKKLISRTFNLEIRTAFCDVDLKEDFDLKIKFTGFPDIEAAYFKSKRGSSSSYEDLYNDPVLLEELEECARRVDIGYIIVSYNKRARKLSAAISPYAGALLWLMFPPVSYKLPLTADEMEVLWIAMEAIRKHSEKILDKEKDICG